MREAGMRQAGPPIAVVMGVSGCGKTFVGGKLAKAIGVDFIEGDKFHPPENIALMSSGRPLDDAHRDLVATLRGMNSVSLAELIGNISDGQRGTRVSYAAMVRGVAQHDAYHTGQIAILKKLFRSRRIASVL